MALRPDLIILDELFSGLSLAEVSSIVPIIEKLKYQGKTIIMIEHRLKELFRIADRVMVLNYGRKIAEGQASRRHGKPGRKGSLSGQRSGVKGKTMLDVQNLMVFFENALALNDFSMEVREGQVVGVIGSATAPGKPP